MKPLFRRLLLLLAALGIPACTRSLPIDTSGSAELAAVQMSGRQEVPPVTSAGSGSATLNLNASHTAVIVTLSVSGLTSITMANIHAGSLGAEGPIIFSLSSGSFASPLMVTLTSASFLPAPTQGITTFDDAVNAMIVGNTYVNVSTTANTDGEIRGQIGPTTLQASLNGGQETPAVASTANGTFSLSLNADQSQMMFSLTTAGLTNITAAHVHAGASGVAGPILFTLATGPFTSPLTGILTSANFTPQATVGITTFNQAVDAILSGNTYVDVHTVANADGEIRGQVQH